MPETDAMKLMMAERIRTACHAFTAALSSTSRGDQTARIAPAPCI